MGLVDVPAEPSAPSPVAPPEDAVMTQPTPAPAVLPRATGDPSPVQASAAEEVLELPSESLLSPEEEPPLELPADNIVSEPRRQPQRRRPRRRSRYSDEPEESWLGREPGFWSRERIWGCIGIIWGLLIIIFSVTTPIQSKNAAYIAGARVGLGFGILMFFAGIYYLLRG
jgi:hypothetical protein